MSDANTQCKAPQGAAIQASLLKASVSQVSSSKLDVICGILQAPCLVAETNAYVRF